MPRTDANGSLTARQVRAQPWPSAVKSRNTPLAVGDCYTVGKIIVETLHWTQTRGRQEWSLRRLQSQILKDASISTLSRCVRVYRIARELSIRPPWKNLDMRHFVATGSLPPAKRKQLLQQVEKHGWSVSKLELLVRDKYGSPGRGGQTVVECVRALEQLEQRDVLSDLNRLKLYTKTDLRKLARRVDAATKTFQSLRDALKDLGV